jgi:transcriptional regulator with XRE-family HTH domain
MTFGEKIKELRLRKDLGLREFCLMFSLDASNWSKIERGRIKPLLPREYNEETKKKFYNDTQADFLTRNEDISLIEYLCCQDEKVKDEVMALYYIARKEIPDEIAYNEEKLKTLLPLFVRFRDKKKYKELVKFLEEGL